MRDAAQGQEGVGPASGHQRLRQPQRMSDGHVVVGESMDEHQRAMQARSILDDAIAAVDLRVHSQITLGVMRVVQRPVRRRSACTGGVEHLGRVDDGQCGQEPPVGPSDYRDPVQIRLGGRLGQRADGLDLIGEGDVLHVVDDLAIP